MAPAAPWLRRSPRNWRWDASCRKPALRRAITCTVRCRAPTARAARSWPCSTTRGRCAATEALLRLDWPQDPPSRSSKMRSGNPVLGENTFLDVGSGAVVSGGPSATMSINGTVNKAGLMLVLLVLGAAFTWSRFDGTPVGAQAVLPWVAVGAIGGLIVALITIFKKTWSPVTAPIYAVLEGLFLGGVSAMFELRFPGIVMQAVMLTFGTLFALLMAYRSGLIKATENFKLGVVAATGGIALIYLATIALSFFGIRVPYLHESGLVGIGFSLFVVVVAALNLVLDFDFIEKGVEQGAPKHMEWYGAFGLMVTLVWLYVEFLRLLGKLRN